MELIKKLFIILLILINIPFVSFGMEEAIREKIQKWEEKKPKYPEDEAQKAQLAKERAALETNIEKQKENESKTQSDEEELALNEKKLDYYDQVIKQFDFTERYKETKNPEDKKLADNAAQEQKTLDKDITEKITQDIQRAFNPSGGGTSKTNIITKVIETLQEKVWKPLKETIDAYTKKAINRELSVKQAKKSQDKILKKVEKEFIENKTPAEGTQQPPIIPGIKSLGEKLDLMAYAYSKPENLEIEQQFNKFLSDYINNAVNDDIKYTIQHQKDTKALQKYYEETVDKLSALGVDKAQIDKLTIEKDNAVKKIIEQYKSPELKNQVTKFFDPKNTNAELSITAYEKLADETSKLTVNNAGELQKLRDNVAQLRSTVDALNNYATYALDELPVKAQTQLLEFLQDQQILLQTYYQNISISHYLKSEELMTIISDMKTVREDLDATQKRIVDNAEITRVKNEKRLEVQQLEKENSSAKILNDAFLKLGNEAIPTSISEIKNLLVKSGPLGAEVITKFDALSRGIEGFVSNMEAADPSRKALDAAEMVLTSIDYLEDYIRVYNDITELSRAQQDQLVKYYVNLDKLYTKVASQGVKDMNSLFKTLNDGSIIYLDYAKRTQPDEAFIQQFARQGSPNVIEAWFKAGRLDMTTSEDISG